MPKGGYRENAGRKKGSKNEKSMMWESLGSYLVENGAERALKVIQQMNDKEFLRSYMDLLEYFKPKQARTELSGDKDNPISINIIRGVNDNNID